MKSSNEYFKDDGIIPIRHQARVKSCSYVTNHDFTNLLPLDRCTEIRGAPGTL